MDFGKIFTFDTRLHWRLWRTCKGGFDPQTGLCWKAFLMGNHVRVPPDCAL